MTPSPDSAALQPPASLPTTVSEIADVALRDKTQVGPAFAALAGIGTSEAVQAIERITSRYRESLPVAVDAVAPLLSASQGEARAAVIDLLSVTLYHTYGVIVTPEAKSAREKTLALMGEDKGDDVVASLELALERNPYYGNADVLKTLERIGSKAAVAVITQAVAKPGHEEVLTRERLAILGRIGSEEAMAAIARLAQREPHPYAHAHALAFKGAAAIPHLAGLARSHVAAIAGAGYHYLSWIDHNEARTIAAEVRQEFADELGHLNARARTILDRIAQEKEQPAGMGKPEDRYADAISEIASSTYSRSAGDPVLAMTILADLHPLYYSACDMIRALYKHYPEHADTGRGILQSIGNRTAQNAMLKDVTAYEEAYKVARAMMSMEAEPGQEFDVLMKEFAQVPESILYTFDRTEPNALRGALLMSRYSERWQVEANAILKSTPSVENIEMALASTIRLKRQEPFITLMGEIGTEAALAAVTRVAVAGPQMRTAKLGIAVLAASGHPDQAKPIAHIATMAGCEVEGVQALIALRKKASEEGAPKITAIMQPMIKSLANPHNLKGRLAEISDDDLGRLKDLFTQADQEHIAPGVPEGYFADVFNDATQLVALEKKLKLGHLAAFAKPAPQRT